MALTQGISLGDAVLSVIVDLSQFDQAMARIQAETAAKLQPAAAAATALGAGFDKAAASAGVAAEQTAAAGEQIRAVGAASSEGVVSIELLAQSLIAEGKSATGTAAELVKLGYARTESSIAAANAATAFDNAARASAAAMKQTAEEAAKLGTSVTAATEKAVPAVAGIASAVKPADAAITALGAGFVKAGASAATAAPQVAAAAVSTAAASSASQQLAQRLMAEGLSAAEATSALVNLGYSQKEAAAATGLTTVAIAEEGVALRSVAASAAVASAEVETFGKRATAGFNSPRMELMAIEQGMGVRLPRAVTAFLSTLPGVGELISTAFSAAVVFFLIEAIVKLAKAGSDWVASTFIYTDAMKRMDEAAGLLNKELAAQVEELKKLKNAYDLIGLQGTAKTSEEFAQLSVEAGKASSNVRQLKDEMYGLRNGMVSLPAALGLVNGLIADLYKNLPKDELEKHLVPDGASRDRILSELGTFLAKAQAIEANFDEKKLILEKTNDRETVAEQIAVGQAKIAATRQIADAAAAVELQEALIRNTRLKVSYLEDARAQTEANEQKYRNTLAFLEQQKALEAESLRKDIGPLEARRAQEPQQLAAINAQIEDVQREHAAASTRLDGEILAAEKNHQAEQLSNRRKYLEERQKLNRVEHEAQEKQLQDELVKGYPTEKIDAFAQATDRLTQADLRLATAEARLALTNIAQDFGPQEAAITALANFKIITEQQKAQRLQALYQQEESDALKALNDLAAKEKTALTAAQTAVDKILKNPIGHQAELDAALENLDRITAAYTHTEQEITKTAETYEAKRTALAKSYYGEALNLALASGDKLLAAELRENHAALLAAQAELIQARARGANTAAIQKEIAELIKLERQLEKGAGSVKQFGNVSTISLRESAQAWITQGLVAAASAATAGEAAQKLASSVLQSLAAYAIPKAIEQLALGFAALSPTSPDFGHAGEHFASSAEWFLAAGAAAAVGSLVGGGSSSSSSGLKSPGATAAPLQPAQTPTQQPVQTVNVAHLAGGGLFTKRTMAVIGDSPRGGDQREAVVPLGNDSNALDEIAGRISERISVGSGGGDTHIHIKGDVIDHNQLMRRLSLEARKGKGRLTANNSLRLTRRG